MHIKIPTSQRRSSRSWRRRSISVVIVKGNAARLSVSRTRTRAPARTLTVVTSDFQNTSDFSSVRSENLPFTWKAEEKKTPKQIIARLVFCTCRRIRAVTQHDDMMSASGFVPPRDSFLWRRRYRHVFIRHSFKIYFFNLLRKKKNEREKEVKSEKWIRGN